MPTSHTPLSGAESLIEKFILNADTFKFANTVKRAAPNCYVGVFGTDRYATIPIGLQIKLSIDKANGVCTMTHDNSLASTLKTSLDVWNGYSVLVIEDDLTSKFNTFKADYLAKLTALA